MKTIPTECPRCKCPHFDFVHEEQKRCYNCATCWGYAPPSRHLRVNRTKATQAHDGTPVQIPFINTESESEPCSRWNCRCSRSDGTGRLKKNGGR